MTFSKCQSGDVIMDYEKFYDMVQEEMRCLMEMDIYKDDYQLIKTLAALYQLQDYLANRLAEEIAGGKRDDFC